MKILTWAGSALFALFAVLQLNDTDPEVYHKASVIDAWLWAGFYAMVATCFVFKALGKLPRILLVIASIACLLEMADTVLGVFQNMNRPEGFHMAQTSMSSESPEVELSREFFGAALALGGILFLWRKEKS